MVGNQVDEQVGSDRDRVVAAVLLGGELNIVSNGGEGTTVKAVVPKAGKESAT